MPRSRNITRVKEDPRECFEGKMVSCVTLMEWMGFDINTDGVHVSVGGWFSFGLGSAREYENIDKDGDKVCMNEHVVQ